MIGVELPTVVHLSPVVPSVAPMSGGLAVAEKAGLPFQICDPDTLIRRGATVTVVVPGTKVMV